MHIKSRVGSLRKHEGNDYQASLFVGDDPPESSTCCLQETGNMTSLCAPFSLGGVADLSRRKQITTFKINKSEEFYQQNTKIILNGFFFCSSLQTKTVSSLPRRICPSIWYLASAASAGSTNWTSPNPSGSLQKSRKLFDENLMLWSDDRATAFSGYRKTNADC